MKSLDDVFNDDVVFTDHNVFVVARSLGYSLGRAYFNCLNSTERNILRNSEFDPFYMDTPKGVLAAHEYLRSQLLSEAV